MKSLRVFLLILGLFSFVKIALSLNCYKSHIDKELSDNCMDKIEETEPNPRKQLEMSQRFACLRKATISKKENCPESTTACTTAIYDLKDQTELLTKFCDDSEKTACDKFKKDSDKTFPTYGFAKRLYCDSCSSDYCNDKIPRNKSSLSEATVPTPKEKPPSPKQKVSDSRSAVSTPPSATPAFVAVFITLLLLL